MQTHSQYISLLPNDYINANFGGLSPNLNALCCRLLAPNDKTEIAWIKEHIDHFGTHGVLWGNDRLWVQPGAPTKLPETPFKNNHQLHVIYKTAKTIVTKCGTDIETSRSLNALLSRIVWCCRSEHPDGNIIYTHTMAIRRSMLWLINIKQAPSVQRWQSGNSWLTAAISELDRTHPTKATLDNKVALSDKKLETLRGDLKILQRILDNELNFGANSRNKALTKRDAKGINNINMASNDAYVNQYYIDTLRGVAVSKKVTLNKPNEDDDDKKGLEVAFEASALPTNAVKHIANYADDAMRLGRVQGFFKKETDTAELAASKLSLFAPGSTEALTMILLMALGRLSLASSEVRVKGHNTLIIASIIDPLLTVELVVPAHWDISLIPGKFNDLKTQLKTESKTTLRLTKTACTLEGIARFGAFKFHGKVGAVVAAQLQGKITDVKVTAGYCSLSTFDFQKSFNTLLEDVLKWIADEACFVGSEWKDWASNQIKAPIPSIDKIAVFGSQKSFELNGYAKKSINKELNEKFNLATFRQAPREVSSYLTACALALHAALQVITGARPVSSVMKLAVGAGLISLSDKAWGPINPARMICVPPALTNALLRHKKNTLTFARQMGALRPNEACPIHHPFVTVTINQNNKAVLEPISTGQLANWLSEHIGHQKLAANGLRHTKITELQQHEYSDGILTHLVGHERRGESIFSQYPSAPAALQLPPTADAWIPKIHGEFLC